MNDLLRFLIVPALVLALLSGASCERWIEGFLPPAHAESAAADPDAGS